ncbi:MAG: DUF1667 domain-containing protein [Ruminococcaceae bacterium]|nr:DUF1667 domain-containing protein [Oscillospiraceae bacterium]
MTRELTCIICPRGCAMKIELDESGKFISVSGNLCPRGKKYAENECTNPMRTLTTTAKCSDGSVVAVRSEGAIPKGKLFEAMSTVNSIVVPLPVSVGDVILDDFYGTKLIATANKG